MKRVIDGKRYDTATAVKIAAWDNGLYSNDFGWCEESLYRTKNGNYFLAGEGGPMSGYSQSCGNNSYSGGEGIQALTPDEALEWLENKGKDVPEGCPELAALVVEA